MAPPGSSPRLREIIKYSPPTPTFILVAMADALNPVIKVIELAITTISMVLITPTFPTTQPKRRNIIRPKIVRILGV
jgi:hypothetical protein